MITEYVIVNSVLGRLLFSTGQIGRRCNGFSLSMIIEFSADYLVIQEINIVFCFVNGRLISDGEKKYVK